MIRTLMAAGAIGTIAWFSPMHDRDAAQRARSVQEAWTQQAWTQHRDASGAMTTARLAGVALNEPALREAALREAARAFQR